MRTALVRKINDGVATVQDVLLAVHHALRSSALDDQHRRGRHRQAELWRQGAPRSHRPPVDYEAIWIDAEGDVWILMTT